MCNWRMVHGFHWSYNNFIKNKSNLQNAEIIAQSSLQTQQWQQRKHLEGKKRKFKTYLKKMSLDLEDMRELEMKFECTE